MVVSRYLVYMHSEPCHEELAHAITEDEKSYDLLSANWTPRKAGGVIQTNSQGLRIWGAYDLNCSLRARKDDMSPLMHVDRKQKGANSSFLIFFC